MCACVDVYIYIRLHIEHLPQDNVGSNTTERLVLASNAMVRSHPESAAALAQDDFGDFKATRQSHCGLIAGASEPPAGLSSKLKQVDPTVSPALHFLKPEFHQQMVEIEFSLRFPGASATIKFHQMPTKSAPGRLVYGRTDT